MNDIFKKSRWMLYLSKSKLFIILIITCCLILGGISPTINSFLIKNNNETFKDDYNKADPNYKKTNYDDDVRAFASFYWSPRYPDPGEKVTFYSSSHAFNGYIITERWELEEGKRDYGYKTSHTFNKKGSYRVTLRVSAVGTHGGHDWDYQTSYVKVGADPFPRIIFTPESPLPGEKVRLDASKSNDPDGKITSYDWSYYNVKNSSNVTYLGSDEVIFYIWDEQGIYNVLLDIVDDKGNNNTIGKTIHVSILKIDGFSTLSRKISFQISNQGTIKAKNIKWSLKIDKYRLFGLIPRPLYQKNGTIELLDSGNSEEIKLRYLRRAFCKIKLVVTAEADNAIEVSKSYYGFVFGKFIYLTEKDIVSPFRILLFAGLGITLMFIIISMLQIVT